jgi:two-component system cell cycle sensor histidine kinase/response regulator CckA
MSEQICLIVDDEPSIRAYLKVILQRECFHVLEAENAAQALRTVQRLDGGVDVIVSDIKMPGEMDGIDLVHSLRNSYPGVPIILISGYADDDSVKQATASFVFIQKPFVPDTLLKAVQKVMAERRSM